VIHARTDLWLGLELRADRLFITARDGSPRLLRTVSFELEAEGGGGCGWWSSWPGPGGSAPHPGPG